MNGLIVGSTQGIGLGFVKQLLADAKMTRLYATYRQQPSAELLALQDQYPDVLSCLPLDITDEQQISECLTTIGSQTEALHLVINCVGILHDGTFQPEKSLRQLNTDQLSRYFQVNSIGAALLAKHLLPLVTHAERSIFATISAKVGSIGDNQLGGWYGYRASKAALNMLIKTAALEYRRKSPNTILVLLHPGTTDTNLSRPFQRSVPSDKLFTVERTVTQLLTVLSHLEADDSGEFFNWDGSRLPW
jgi:NAD(P)-dependent dehydrogenase (short-subunit alcohol dehydrogenase family)